MTRNRGHVAERCSFRIALVLAAFLLLASGTWADSGATFSVTAMACDIQNENVVTGCHSSTSSGPFVTATSASGLETASAGATFSASDGSISVSAGGSGEADDLGFCSSTMGAVVSFSDVVTIIGSNGSGELTFTADQNGNAFFDFGPSISSFGIDSNIPTTFVFGVPFEISADVSVDVIAAMASAQAFANFTLTSLTVSDANGNPLSGYSYTDASNTAYPFLGGELVITPEPASGMLIVLGLMCITCWRFKLRSAR